MFFSNQLLAPKTPLGKIWCGTRARGLAGGAIDRELAKHSRQTRPLPRAPRGVRADVRGRGCSEKPNAPRDHARLAGEGVASPEAEHSHC